MTDPKILKQTNMITDLLLLTAAKLGPMPVMAASCTAFTELILGRTLTKEDSVAMKVLWIDWFAAIEKYRDATNLPTNKVAVN